MERKRREERKWREESHCSYLNSIIIKLNLEKKSCVNPGTIEGSAYFFWK